MRPRLAAIIVIIWVAILAGHFPAIAQTTPPDQPQPLHYIASQPFAPPTTINPKTMVAVMLELAGPAAITAGSRANVQRQSISNARQQERALRHQNMSGVRVLFRTQIAYNGMAVAVPYERLNQLRQIENVVGIHPISPKERSSIDVAAIMTTAQWTYGGATGQGVRVAIIDSGIDYTHATFGGAGTAAAYSNNNPTTVEPGSFPTAKVRGGYDFAGNNYNADGGSGSPLPTPDADPLDCNGHGSHIASATAGFGVTSAGQTYQGPYNSSLNPANFQVTPGIAPRATLYAYKVFGCQGTTALLIDAIERALDPNNDDDISDRLDVMVVAMSTPFGSDSDPDAVAVNNAVRHGAVVVTAAGDNGNTFHVLSSPSSARLAITVGATNESSNTVSSTAGLAPFSSRGPLRGHSALKPELVAPGVAVRAAAVGSGTAATTLSGTSIATASAAGAAIVLRELHPSWTPLQIKAALVGGATPVPLGNTFYPPSQVGGGRINLADLADRSLLAYTASAEPSVGLTFGAPWLPQQAVTLTRAIVLENTERFTRTVALSASTVATEPGVALALPLSPFDIPANSQVTLPVTLTVQPGALDFSRDPSTPAFQNRTPRYYLAEHGGYIEANSTNAQLRFVHAANRDTVAVYVDEAPLAQQLDSNEVTEYSSVPVGRHTVRVVSVDPPQSTPLLTSEVELPAAGSYSLMLIGQNQQLDVLPIDEGAALANSAAQARPLRHSNAPAHIRYVNSNLPGSQGPGNLDVYFDETLVLTGLAPGETSPTLNIAPGTHVAAFIKSGQPLSASSLVAWQVFVAAPGGQLLIGAGQYDEQNPRSTAEAVEIIKAAIASGEIDPSRCNPFCQGVWADFQQGQGWISQAWRRGVTADTVLMSVQEEISLRLPFNILPMMASSARAASPSLSIPRNNTTFSLPLDNTGARNAGAHYPLVGAFELTAASAPLTPSSPADLRYLGVTSNISYTSVYTPASSGVFFAIATHQPWSTPNEVQFRVYIDSNRDGSDDYVISTTTYTGSLTAGAAPTDTFINVTYPIVSGQPQASPRYTVWNTFTAPITQTPSGVVLDGAPFNSSVTILSTRGSWIGLGQRSSFNYRVESYARDTGRFQQVIDRIPENGSYLTYNIAQTALQPLSPPTSPTDIGPRPIFRDWDSGVVEGRVNTAILAGRANQRLLLLHLHNPPGTQAELVSVSTPASQAGPPANGQIRAGRRDEGGGGKTEAGQRSVPQRSP